MAALPAQVPFLFIGIIHHKKEEGYNLSLGKASAPLSEKTGRKYISPTSNLKRKNNQPFLRTYTSGLLIFCYPTYIRAVQSGRKIRQTLCKQERLTRRKLIEQLQSDGKSIKTPAIILVHRFAELPCEFPAQVMVTASKRLFKRAHDRNRIKRLMREAYRKQKHIVYTSLSERKLQATLLFIFTGKQLPNQAYVHGKILELLKRFNEELEKNKPNELG